MAEEKIYQYSSCELTGAAEYVYPDFCGCVPDPEAGPFQDWTEMDPGTCYFEPRVCKYMAVVESSYLGPGGEEAVGERLDMAVSAGVAHLVEFYNKRTEIAPITDLDEENNTVGYVDLPISVGYTTEYEEGEAVHDHIFVINNEGNGWAWTKHHPKAPSIYHNHGIQSYVIQEKGSDCYPECSASYGYDGVAPHNHEIPKDELGSRIYATFNAGDETAALLTEIATAEKYYVDTRPLAPMKVLVGVPSDIFDTLPENHESEMTTDGETTIAAAGGSALMGEKIIELTYNELHTKIRRVSRGLKIYAQYEAAWAMTNGARIENLNLAAEARRLKEFRGELMDFLSDNGLAVGPFSPIKKVDGKNAKLEIIFNSEYKITQITLKDEGCSDRILRKGFKKFLKQSPVNWPTTCAYVANIVDMDIEITAREPTPWQDFIIKYTYPAVTLPESSGGIAGEDLSLLGCMIDGVPTKDAAALMKNILLDELMKSADMLVMQYGQQLCHDKEDIAARTAREAQSKTLQALVDLEEAINDIIDFPILGEMEHLYKATKEKGLRGAFQGFFEPMGACGFAALIQTSLGCFMDGLGFDAMMKKIVTAAVNAMNEEVLGFLIKGLPKEVQDQIKASVLQAVAQSAGQQSSGDELDVNAYFDNSVATYQEALTTYDEFYANALIREDETQTGEDWMSYKLTLENDLLNYIGTEGNYTAASIAAYQDEGASSMTSYTGDGEEIPTILEAYEAFLETLEEGWYDPPPEGEIWDARHEDETSAQLALSKEDFIDINYNPLLTFEEWLAWEGNPDGETIQQAITASENALEWYAFPGSQTASAVLSLGGLWDFSENVFADATLSPLPTTLDWIDSNQTNEERFLGSFDRTGPEDLWNPDGSGLLPGGEGTSDPFTGGGVKSVTPWSSQDIIGKSFVISDGENEAEFQFTTSLWAVIKELNVADSIIQYWPKISASKHDTGLHSSYIRVSDRDDAAAVLADEGDNDDPYGPYFSWKYLVEDVYESIWGTAPSVSPPSEDADAEFQVIMRELINQMVEMGVPTGEYHEVGSADGSTLEPDIWADHIVKYAQERLMALGYDLPDHGADGDWGNESQTAAKAMQAANGLPETGEIGASEWAVLSGQEDAQWFPTTEQFQIANEESSGTYNQYVYQAQEKLQEYGYDLGEGDLDGKLGPDTTTALGTFQAETLIYGEVNTFTVTQAHVDNGEVPEGTEVGSEYTDTSAAVTIASSSPEEIGKLGPLTWAALIVYGDANIATLVGTDTNNLTPTGQLIDSAVRNKWAIQVRFNTEDMVTQIVDAINASELEVTATSEMVDGFAAIFKSAKWESPYGLGSLYGPSWTDICRTYGTVDLRSGEFMQSGLTREEEVTEDISVVWAEAEANEYTLVGHMVKQGLTVSDVEEGGAELRFYTIGGEDSFEATATDGGMVVEQTTYQNVGFTPSDVAGDGYLHAVVGEGYEYGLSTHLISTFFPDTGPMAKFHEEAYSYPKISITHNNAGSDYSVTMVSDDTGVFYTDAAGLGSSTGAYGTDTVDGYPDPMQYGVTFDGEAMFDLIIDYYKAALLQAYENAMEDLLDALEGLPGAELVMKIMALLDCPSPKIFNEPLPEWFKALDLNPCRGLGDIVLPEIVFEAFPIDWPALNIKAFFISLAKTVLFNTLTRILLAILAKVMKLLLRGACAAMKKVGQLTATGLQYGIQGIYDDLREMAGCPEDATEEEVAQAAEQMLESMGITADSSLEDVEAAESSIESLISTIGTVLTEGEFVDLMNGKATEATSKMLKNIIPSAVPAYADALSSEASIEKMFKTMGEAVDMEQFNEKYEEAWTKDPVLRDMPVRPNLCTDGKRSEFDQLRAALLDDKDPDMTDEQIEEQLDLLDELENETANELIAVLQDGLGEYVADQLPPIVSPGACGVSGLFPLSPTPADAAAVGAPGGGMEPHSGILETTAIQFFDDILGRKGIMNNVLADKAGQRFSFHNRLYRTFWGREGFPPIPAGSYPRTVGLYQREKLLSQGHPYSVLQTSSYDAGDISTGKAGGQRTDQAIFIYDSPSSNHGYTGYNGLTTDYTWVPNDQPAPVMGTTTNPDGTVDYYYYVPEYESKDRAPDATMHFTDADGAQPRQNAYEIIVNYWDHMIDDTTQQASTNDRYRLQIVDAAEGDSDVLLDVEVDNELSEQVANAIDSLGDGELDLTSGRSQQAEAFATLAMNGIREKFGEDVEDSAYDALHEHFATRTYNAINSKILKGMSFEICRPAAGPNETIDPTLAPAYYWGEKFPGTEEQYPALPMHTSPGLLGMAGKMVPPWDAQCDPISKPVIDWSDLESHMNNLQSSLPLDDRLSKAPSCVVNPPFRKIQSQLAMSGCEGMILAFIRVTLIDYFIKGYATFSTFKAQAPGTFDDLFISYATQNIVELVKIDSGTAYSGLILTVPATHPNRYWYEFLEQSVRVCRRLIKDGEIEDNETLTAANEAIKDITRRWKEEKVQAKLGFDPWKIKYRKEWENWVASGEAHAMVFLRALVGHELKTAYNIAYEVFGTPKYTSVDSVILGQQSDSWFPTMDVPAGASGDTDNRFGNYFQTDTAFSDISVNGIRALDENIRETDRFADGWFILEKYIRVTDLNDEFYYSDGTSTVRNSGLPDADTGSEEANSDIPTGVQNPSIRGEATDYTYRHIVNLDSWKTWVDENFTDDAEAEPDKLGGFISDHFTSWHWGLRICYVPGLATHEDWDNPTEEQDVFDAVFNNTSWSQEGGAYGMTKAYTVKGESGDRGMGEKTISGAPYVPVVPLVSVELEMDGEVNVLDFETTDYDISCMLDLLVKTDEYKLLFDYCFPAKRHLGLAAIYNINTFLPSIGQYEFGEQDIKRLPFNFVPPESDFARPYSTEYADEEAEDGAGEFKSVSSESSGNEPWGSIENVNSKLISRVVDAFGGETGPGGVSGFRAWDQDSFEETRKTIKKTFREYYNADDATYKDEDEQDTGGLMGAMRDRLQPARLDKEDTVPWWKKRRWKKRKYREIRDLDECGQTAADE